MNARIDESTERKTILDLGSDKLTMSSSSVHRAELLPWPGPSEIIGDHLCLVLQSKDNVEQFEIETVINDS